MNKQLLRVCICLVVNLLSIVPLGASNLSQSKGTLSPSVVTDKHLLSSEEIHRYRAELEAGVWRLSVTQYGIDTLAELVLPDGVERGPFNSPAGRRGTESFLFTLETSGTVLVSIRPRSKRASDGHYTLVIDRLTSAVAEQRTLSDEEQMRAESTATAAARSFAEGLKEDARESYRQALSVWPASDTAGRARALVALAILAGSQDEPAEAAKLFRRALTDWQTLGDRVNEATTLNRLGLTLDRLGESATARGLFEQAILRWQELEDPHGEVPARLNLCLALQRQGDFAEARSCYQAGLSLVRELRQPSREIVVLSNLAGVHWRLGEPDQALALYEKILTRSDTTSTDSTRARVLTTRALLFFDLGEAEQALLDYGRALAIFRRLKDRRMEGSVLSYLGSAYLGLGELDRARTYSEQALPLLESAGDRRGVAGAWRNLGRTYGRQEDWPQAFEAYGNALKLSQDLADRRGEATLLRLLGEAHAEAGHLRRAEAELQRATEIQRQFGDRGEEATALLELGKVHHRLHDPERALKLLGQARDVFRDLRDRAQEARALEAVARAERDRGRPAEAMAATAAAVELIDDLRTRAGGLRQRAAFLAARRGVYELHIELLMQRHLSNPEAGYDRQAFAVSERARSRAVLDLIRADTKLDGDLSRRLKAATRRLAARTQRQMTILGREHGVSEAVGADREVAAALTELEAVQAEARRLSSSYDQLVGRETSDTVEVAGLLDSKTLLLEYSLGERRSFLWAIGPDSMTSFELPGREHIEALARQAHTDLSVLDLRTGRTSRKALDELSRWLLAPVAEHLAAAQRLVVVADGALHYLPFAALSRPDTDELLVVSHEVVHLPSASTLAWQRRRGGSREPTKTLAVLADPVFDDLDSRLPTSRGPSIQEEAASVDLLARVRGDLGPLGRLSATGHEAEAIAGLVEEPDQRLLALGFNAHRKRVLSGELASYRYVHFATHGVINAHRPELSGLVLALFDSHGRTRNGFLSMDDVYGLELSAEMVVLSGCQTALGKEIRGEGLLGLTRGFMAAGVPRVVASLWPVQDEATARLMERFYHGILVEGKAPAAALAGAQRAIREHSPWSDPYFWSAFVLLGDWR